MISDGKKRVNSQDNKNTYLLYNIIIYNIIYIILYIILFII